MCKRVHAIITSRWFEILRTADIAVIPAIRAGRLQNAVEQPFRVDVRVALAEPLGMRGPRGPGETLGFGTDSGSWAVASALPELTGMSCEAAIKCWAAGPEVQHVREAIKSGLRTARGSKTTQLAPDAVRISRIPSDVRNLPVKRACTGCGSATLAQIFEIGSCAVQHTRPAPIDLTAAAWKEVGLRSAC